MEARISGRISNHAFGRAIDFDPRENPYFTLKELKLIEEISGVKIKRDRKTNAARRWNSLDRASKRFKKRVRRWIRVQRTKLRKEKRRARRKNAAGKRAKRRAAVIEKRLRLVTKGRNLSQARKTGLMTFSKDFVVSMEKAGFVWGIHFGSGADVMHFANH